MKVVLDIETLQASREEWSRLAGIESVACSADVQNPSPDLFEYSDVQERIRKENESYEKSAFDGTFSRIVCIGLLVFTDALDPKAAVCWYGSNERELLRHFWIRIGEIRPSLYITHNGLGFDLPFLKKRSIIQQVKPSTEINLARFRTEPVYDTMAIWSNWDARGWIKLDVLARCLNVETKSGSGKQIAEMWASGQGKAIAEYCLQDTYVTYACYQRMNFLQLMSREKVLGHAHLIELNAEV